MPPTNGETSNHPFYSFDSGAYVPAGSLQEGERLLTYSGDTKRVVSKLARPGPETVYNLEVFGEHFYFIGHDGVLVHNSDSYGLNTGVPNSSLVRGSNPSRLAFEGMEFRAVRDLSHVDESTLRTMARDGFAAKDINGKKLHLHHLNQNPNGPIVEIPGFRHNAHNPVQQPLGTAPGVGLTKAQREAFDGVRVRYWKARAIEELSLRGLTR